MTRPRNDAPRRLTRAQFVGELIFEPDGAVVIRLPHRLESPNTLLHAHWRERTREKKAWRARLLIVMGDACRLSTLSNYARPYDALLEHADFAWRSHQAAPGRRRVVIDRQVPTRRNFIRDRDNLIYSAKPLLDQVRQLGFIHDDAEKHIDLEVTQRVSADRTDWTVIRITAAADSPSTLPAAGTETT